MHLEQILRNLENDFGTLSQKTGLNDSDKFLAINGSFLSVLLGSLVYASFVTS